MSPIVTCRTVSCRTVICVRTVTYRESPSGLSPVGCPLSTSHTPALCAQILAQIFWTLSQWTPQTSALLTGSFWIPLSFQIQFNFFFSTLSFNTLLILTMLTTGLCLLDFIFFLLSWFLISNFHSSLRQAEAEETVWAINTSREKCSVVFVEISISSEKVTGKCFCETISNDKTEVNLKIGSC